MNDGGVCDQIGEYVLEASAFLIVVYLWSQYASGTTGDSQTQALRRSCTDAAALDGALKTVRRSSTCYASDCHWDEEVDSPF